MTKRSLISYPLALHEFAKQQWRRLLLTCAERRPRCPRFTVQEIVEMVQTAGSDVEEYEEDGESGYSAGEEEGGESGSNSEADVEEEEGVGWV